jgi:hypothetical protein
MGDEMASTRATQIVSKLSTQTQPPVKVDADLQTCAHCNALNEKGSFICYSCGNLLEVPPPEKATHVLDEDNHYSYSADHFGENSTLVLRLRGTTTAYQLTARQLKLGQIVGRNTAGHSPYAHIDLTNQDGERLGVSRRHLHLSYDPRHMMIKVTDLKSSNGTYVNSQKLLPGEVRVLRHGDRIRLGKAELAVTILHAATSIEM